MTRRKMLLMTASATAVGLVTLVTLADQNAVFANDDEGQKALIKLMDAAKIDLQQGLTASEQGGAPISAKFEVDKGTLQLSVYTAKQGKFFEVLVNYASGQVLKVEPITDGEDLAAANSQITAMTKAKTALKEAVNKAAAQSAKTSRIKCRARLKGWTSGRFSRSPRR